LLSLGISILLRHAKIDDMDDIGGLGGRSADQEIVGFYVAIDQVLFMDRLDPRELYGVSEWGGRWNDGALPFALQP